MQSLARSITKGKKSQKFISTKKLEELAQESILMKSILSILKLTQENMQEPMTAYPVTSYVRVKLQTVEVQWVLGMSLESHEENFVTLNNRNFTKLILD